MSKVNAIIRDSAPNYVCAKKLLRKKYPTIVFMPCQSHECNLLVLDMIRDSFIKGVVDNAITVASYFRKAGRALQHLRMLCGAPGFRFKIPTDTRWCSYYDTLKQLLDVQEHLEHMVDDFYLLETYNVHIITNENVRKIICDKAGFWTPLADVATILEVYSIAPIVLEGRHATLADAVFV